MASDLLLQPLNEEEFKIYLEDLKVLGAIQDFKLDFPHFYVKLYEPVDRIVMEVDNGNTR